MTGSDIAILYEGAPHCVVRRQEEQYLVYNSLTDELHLLSPIGFYLYSLCDGSSPLNEVQAIFESVTRSESGNSHSHVAEFLEKLEARGLIRQCEWQP